MCAFTLFKFFFAPCELLNKCTLTSGLPRADARDKRVHNRKWLDIRTKSEKMPFCQLQVTKFRLTLISCPFYYPFFSRSPILFGTLRYKYSFLKLKKKHSKTFFISILFFLINYIWICETRKYIAKKNLKKGKKFFVFVLKRNGKTNHLYEIDKNIKNVLKKIILALWRFFFKIFCKFLQINPNTFPIFDNCFFQFFI